MLLRKLHREFLNYYRPTYWLLWVFIKPNNRCPGTMYFPTVIQIIYKIKSYIYSVNGQTQLISPDLGGGATII